MATCKYLKENLRPPFKFQNVCKNLFIRETHRFHHFSRLILQLIYKNLSCKSYHPCRPPRGPGYGSKAEGVRHRTAYGACLAMPGGVRATRSAVQQEVIAAPPWANLNPPVFPKSLKQSSEFSLDSFFQHLIPQLTGAAVGIPENFVGSPENFMESTTGVLHVFSWRLLPEAVCAVVGVISPVSIAAVAMWIYRKVAWNCVQLTMVVRAVNCRHCEWLCSGEDAPVWAWGVQSVIASLFHESQPSSQLEDPALVFNFCHKLDLM